jgi:signal transduction histidine kinase
VPVAASKNVFLYYNIASDVFCTADINSVKLILRNLIDNAIKYTPTNGAVTIAARQENNNCYVTVQDTGIGMDKEIMNALFTGDIRRIQQDTSGRQSTGIGLWLAKNMTERNSGELRISSDIGMGTIVRITLPVNT